MCCQLEDEQRAEETQEFLKEFVQALPDHKQDCVSFFVSGYNLPAAKDNLMGTQIHWGAQNCYFKSSGAFTGENSPEVLKSMGVDQCLVGHSERRQIFKETDLEIEKKVELLQKLQITPMICVGETLEQREFGQTKAVVLSQVKAALNSADLKKDFILAYEPVWAIGTGKVATPEMAEETHKHIRTYLIETMGDSGNETLILYGGSVKPENAKSLWAQPNINGFLVGGASLKVQSLLSLTEVV